MTTKTIKESANADAKQVGKAIESAVQEKGKLIYVGPQIKGVQRFSIFKGGYPPNLKGHIEKCPALKQMFIPVSELHDVQMKLKDGSSVESMFYAKTEEYFKGVK